MRQNKIRKPMATTPKMISKRMARRRNSISVEEKKRTTITISGRAASRAIHLKRPARAVLHREFGGGFYTVLGVFGPWPRAMYDSNDVNLVVEQVIDDAI